MPLNIEAALKILLSPSELQILPFKKGVSTLIFNSFLTSGDFFRLLITFANSLDPDQDQQNVRPDLDQNRS